MKKITFDNQVEKDAAIATEKANHPNPTQYQKEHLADLEAAVLEA